MFISFNRSKYKQLKGFFCCYDGVLCHKYWCNTSIEEIDDDDDDAQHWVDNCQFLWSNDDRFRLR